MKNVEISFLVTFVGYVISLIMKINSNFNPFGAGSLDNLIQKSKVEIGVTFISCIVWLKVLNIIRKKLVVNVTKTYELF
jgi:hypothetical protein